MLQRFESRVRVRMCGTHGRRLRLFDARQRHFSFAIKQQTMKWWQAISNAVQSCSEPNFEHQNVGLIRVEHLHTYQNAGGPPKFGGDTCSRMPSCERVQKGRQTFPLTSQLNAAILQTDWQEFRQHNKDRAQDWTGQGLNARN